MPRPTLERQQPYKDPEEGQSMVIRGNSRPNNWKARGLSSGLCPCGWKSMEGGVRARLPMTFQTSANRAPGAVMCPSWARNVFSLFMCPI